MKAKVVKYLEKLQLRPTVMPAGASCNLSCKYCYCHNIRQSSPTLMKRSVLEATIRKFVEVYPRFISFCWHGGEPLMRGLQFFEDAYRIEMKMKVSPDQIIENRMQTNATLVDSNCAEFLKSHDFKIGVSIDGPQWLNDLHRVDASGKESFKSAMKGIDNLRKLDIPFSAIFTITKGATGYAENLYRFMIEENFTSSHFNPCFGENPFAINPMEYAHFMNTLFDLWFEKDNAVFSIGFFDDILRWLLGGTPSVCHLRNGCYRHVKVDYNGDLVPCDTFLGENFVFGNILRQDLSEIVTDKPYQLFTQAVTTPPKNCLDCKWLLLCHGGCSRYSFKGNLERYPNTMCEARKAMFSHIASVVDSKLIQRSV